ncbi:MAG: decarboxylase [SAR86 cluster bacterium]|jgi:malonyl-CoA decarboxylase|uniref:Decarboxylase n=1 Tax=SAR86 cluster bacterium TaxID=2030880 RepID=A0A368C4Z8_9GAMM|nr:MAG: decarboxylase [SAR86 cluster bacterium]|tara:strand:- start:6900 stop:8153 length:1254 start_codon:yes stop_codon:yes gene_type:complete
MSFFQNIISSIMRNPLRKGLFGGEEFGVLHKDINKALDAVMSTSGEVSSLVYAEHLLNLIEALNDQDLITFLQTLSAKYDIDPGALSKATVNYSKEKNQANLEKVTKSSEPLWVELFRRLNTTQDGTVKLIRLRERIRGLLKDNPEIAFFNSSLLSLFKGWFNPSFLVLEKIDWSTPANILEKIIEYEAVHEINSWDDLRARLAPDDRRCFAFFHPLIPDEPLIFVEVALCNKTPESINEVIKIDREIVNYKDINTAVFYSISNCQDGLSGISFGNFLIKQVAHKLKQEVDSIEKFVTLSPVPGFVRWLESKSKDQNIDDDNLTAEALLYLTASEREDKLPNDPVARFHLGNGAILEKINLNADLSKKGILQSKGMMVNYLYNLELLEKNHELFFKTKNVQQSDEIKSLKKKLQIHT